MVKDPIEGQTVPTRALAERVAKSLGCEGAHKMEDGWAPCESHEALMTLIRKGAAGYREWKNRQSGEKSGRGAIPIRVIVDPELDKFRKRRRKRRCRRHWCNERLGERGVPGIDTLPGGGLVTGTSAGT